MLSACGRLTLSIQFPMLVPHISLINSRRLRVQYKYNTRWNWVWGSPGGSLQTTMRGEELTECKRLIGQENVRQGCKKEDTNCNGNRT